MWYLVLVCLRNAFVWEYQSSDNSWKPTLVILRIERAALDVKWSMDGLRFAATSGAKCVSVCTYEAQNDWWVSKMIRKKFKSTVLCCNFHPTNGQLLATVDPPTDYHPIHSIHLVKLFFFFLSFFLITNIHFFIRSFHF